MITLLTELFFLYGAFIYFFIINWIFFFKFKQNNSIYKKLNFTQFYLCSSETKEPSNFFVNYFLMNLCFLLLNFHVMKIPAPTDHFNLFSLNNFNLFLVYIFLLFNLFFFYILKCLNKQLLQQFKLDYLFTLINIFFFFCLMLLCTNLYTFFFY